MNRFRRTRNSNGNNFSPEDEKRPWPTHGAFSALRLYRERELDLRRSDHRAIREWQMALVEDLGGQSQVDTFQRSMIDRATELLIVIGKMAEHVEQTGVMKGEELSPCLKNSFIAYQNTFRLTLAACFEHGVRKPKKSPDLKDYLKTNYSNLEKEVNENDREKENDSPGDGQDHRPRYESDGAEESGEGGA